MQFRFKNIMQSLLSICLIATLCFINVSVTYGAEIVFSGIESSTLSTLSRPANDILTGVSANDGTDQLNVRVESVTFVRAHSNVANQTNVTGNAAVRNGKYLDLTTQDNGKIFRITYGAYASESSTQILETAVRTMVAFDAEINDDPWMYAETPGDAAGATGVPGSTITYHLFLYNDYEDDVFRVSVPMPANTAVQSADFTYSVSENQIKADITIGEHETKELIFTLSVDSAAAGTIIDCKANYEPMSLEGLKYVSNAGYPVRTVISGSQPDPTYAVIYDANGGINPPSDTDSPYQEGDKVTIIGPGDMAKSGKVFLGWSRLATATQAQYKIADISAGTAEFDMPDEAVTLYAVWRDITDMPDFVSVSVTWSDMEFTFSGSWNSDTHTMSGDWEPNAADGNKIVLTNDGSSDVSVALDYTKIKQEVDGSFYSDAGGTTAITSSIPLPINRSKEAFLFLSGTPDTTMNNSPLGTVTVIIREPIW